MENDLAAVPPALGPTQWQDRDYRPRAADVDAWAARTADRQASDDATQYVAGARLSEGGEGVVVMSRAHETVVVPPPARHALAALALAGQPFGFTPADVAALHRASEWAGRLARVAPDAGDRAAAGEAAAVLERVAARVSALLPPADT
jgi:hypothetical protein